MFFRAVSFCTSNLTSVTALQQDFLIYKVGSKHLMMNIWQQSTLPKIFHLQWSCLKSIVLIARVSRLVIFLMKVFLKLIVNQLSLKEIISGLRLNSQSWEIMDGINSIIVCIRMVPGSRNYKGLLWEDSGLSGKNTTLWFVASLHVTWQKILQVNEILSASRNSFSLSRKLLLEPSTLIAWLGHSWRRASFHLLGSQCHRRTGFYKASNGSLHRKLKIIVLV